MTAPLLAKLFALVLQAKCVMLAHLAGSVFEVPTKLVLALGMSESRGRVDVVSHEHDHGWGQIRRGSATRDSLPMAGGPEAAGPVARFSRMTAEELRRPAVNIYLTVRWMAVAREKCGGPKWSEGYDRPADWLTGYSHAKKCGPSRYSRHVLEMLRRLERRALSRWLSVENWAIEFLETWLPREKFHVPWAAVLP